jgi:peptide/nickel transport system permease protein
MTTSASRLASRAGVALTGAFLAAALVSFVWTPHDAAALDISTRLAPPSLSHWLGTDPLGRDVLSMLMIGARVSILVAFFAVGIGMTLGVPAGLAAAAYGGPSDEAVMRIGDLVFAFPALILAILIAAVFGPGTYTVVIAVGVFNVPVFARLARGASLPFWKSGFILAARAAGKSRARIAFEHILPNIAPVLIVQGTIQFSLAILAEAGLSYVGLGVQPPFPSWGRLLAESQTLGAVAPWLTIFPGLAIFLFVLGLNLLGDGVRERLDRRQRRALQ